METIISCMSSWLSSKHVCQQEVASKADCPINPKKAACSLRLYWRVFYCEARASTCFIPQLSWTSGMSCLSAQCLKEPSSAAWRRNPETGANWPALQETTPQSSPTTPRPGSPESSCPQAPRRSSPLPTELLLVRSFSVCWSGCSLTATTA